MFRELPVLCVPKDGGLKASVADKLVIDRIHARQDAFRAKLNEPDEVFDEAQPESGNTTKTNDYGRDLEWVFQNVGPKGMRGEKKKAPSPFAAKLLIQANKDLWKFDARYAAWKKQVASDADTPDRREMVEDEKETLGQLRRLSKEIAPDIQALIEEASSLFPDVFQQTLMSMGWTKCES